jgi:2-(1,2-epoxy-1,2-dihydrophenyl)acetyl-CoA isomerase
MRNPYAQKAHEFTRMTVTVSEGLAEVRLDWPERDNAADWATATDLLEMSTLLAEDPTVRVVLLAANGRFFSAGGDISMFHGLAGPGLPASLRRMIDQYHLAIQRLSELDAPIVAAVQGAAAGGGLGLVCAADIVIAAEDAMFTMSSTRIGLPADGGTSWYLPRVVGMRRAQEMMLLSSRITATEARDWGLVTRVVPADDLDREARSIAESLRDGPTVAYGEVRRLLRDSMHNSLPEQLCAERDAVVVAAASQDAGEGIAAFTQRRRPAFQGR